MTQLTPFAGNRCGIARLFDHFGNAELLLWSDDRAGTIIQHTGAERVSAGDQHGSRRGAKWSRETTIATDAACCQRVDVWRLIFTAVTANSREAIVICQDKNQIRFVG